MQEYRDTLGYKIMSMFTIFRQKSEFECRLEAMTEEERDLHEMKHKAKHFNQDMTSNEEEQRIRRAKKLWKLVRTKKRVILMMSKLGEGAIQELDKKRFKEIT
jgi:hypothetical protein